MGEAATLAVVALIWDLGAGGWAYAPTPAVSRMVYRATWWLPPVMMVGAGLWPVVEQHRGVVLVLSVVATLTALGSFAFPLRRIPDDSTEVPRRSVVRDPNRRRRVRVLIAAALLVLGAAIAG